MDRDLPGIVNSNKLDEKKLDCTPLALHDNAKENKYGSAEFTHTEETML